MTVLDCYDPMKHKNTKTIKILTSIINVVKYITLRSCLEAPSEIGNGELF